jgi:hypothetical protein
MEEEVFVVQSHSHAFYLKRILRTGSVDDPNSMEK